MLFKSSYRSRKSRFYLNQLKTGLNFNNLNRLNANIVRNLKFNVPKTNLKRKELQLLTYVATGFLILLVAGLISVFGLFAYFSSELPNPDKLLERSYELSTRLFDRKGRLIYEVFGEKNRTLVLLKDISPYVGQATLAVEDSDFYMHQGFSLRGYARAIKNSLTGSGLQGGSTLTQQVIKNTLLTQDRTVSRKIKEFILALQLENRYSKDEILQMYLNESPYGGQNYGVYSAAKAYFNKDPKDLTIAQAAYIAGLPQSPTYYSPYGENPNAGLQRKDYVLYLMNASGWLGSDGRRHYLNDDDYKAAKEEKLTFERAKIAFKAPHFIFYTKDVLAGMYGEDVMEQGGLNVTTSLDMDVQELAEKIVLEEVAKANYENVWNGAMVVLDSKTGQVLAMVGSKDYNADPEPAGCVSGKAGDGGCTFDPYVNVTLSSRQPGSAIKPVTYATMLSKGYTAAFPFLDVQTVFKGAAPDKPYIPENYDGIFRGPMSLRKALGNSENIPAVKALNIVGLDEMINMAEKMGISTFKDRSRYGLALTLGGGETKLLELTGAYSVIAGKGVFRKPTPLVEIKDSNDNLLYKWTDTGQKVLGEDVAFILSDILSDDGARSAAFGTGSLLNIKGHTVAVKTGTTDDKRDNYAMGFTPSITAGVWVGNSNNEKMNPAIASGISGATPIYNRFFTEYLKDKTDEKFTAPENVEKVTIDDLTGMLPADGSSNRSEWFIKGTAPTAKSSWYKRLEICKQDGNLANESCHDNGDTDTETFVKIEAELPEWQDAVDAWVKEKYSGDDKYFPPTIKTALEFSSDGEVDNKDEVYVKIVGLEKDAKVPLRFRLNIEVSSYHDVDRVTIYMDDKKATEDGSRPYGYNFELTADSIGKHTFKATAKDEKDNKGDDSIELEVIGYQVD